MQDFPTPDSVQTYPSHRRYFPPWHFFILPVLAVHVLLQLREAVVRPGPGTAFAFLVAVALALGLSLARWMVLRVQDRVIRLEETLRLERLLPPERRAGVEQLSVKQLVALRFASDAEVPHLVERILDGSLVEPDEIKRDVQHWRPDHLRA
jgi:hypothetical protein